MIGTKNVQISEKMVFKSLGMIADISTHTSFMFPTVVDMYMHKNTTC